MNNFQDQAIDWPESTLRILVFVLLHDSSVKIRQAAIGVLPAYQVTRSVAVPADCMHIPQS